MTDKFLLDQDVVDLEFQSDLEEGDDIELLEKLLAKEVNIEDMDNEDWIEEYAGG
jgi:hypothetical protein